MKSLPKQKNQSSSDYIRECAWLSKCPLSQEWMEEIGKSLYIAARKWLTDNKKLSNFSIPPEIIDQTTKLLERLNWDKYQYKTNFNRELVPYALDCVQPTLANLAFDKETMQYLIYYHLEMLHNLLR